ncbi:uncharacterized protein LOC121372970 [Gigantopelta aegis]|uniref:uncharacterized protein LOC121372970 n=1 Tax=Gigantopelta aegis TaxID=1735272 RepID=UPI001B88C31D|nr:uncharacterized protein LOC121372970 [Gigantopelta aegis]
MDVSLMLLVTVLCILSPVHSDTCDTNCQNGGTPSKECGQCDCVKGYTGFQCELGDVLLNLVVDTTEMFLGLAFTMTCKVTNARGFGVKKSVVEFQRVGGNVLPTYALQKGSKCSGHTKMLGYVPRCGMGTDDVNSNMKIYIMEIIQVTKSDVTDWVCSIMYPKIQKSRIMHFKLAAVNLTMSAESKDAVIDKPFILTCTLEHPTSGLVRGTLEFLRGTNVFGSLRQEGPKCRVITSTSRSYKCKCGKGTDQVGSRVKIYHMEIVRLTYHDKWYWFCGIEFGDKSNKFSFSEFIPCKLKCKNGGSPNDVCDKCNCVGNWTGSTCRECGLTCLNGGTLLAMCSGCICRSGFKGPTCGESVFMLREMCPRCGGSYNKRCVTQSGLFFVMLRGLLVRKR